MGSIRTIGDLSVLVVVGIVYLVATTTNGLPIETNTLSPEDIIKLTNSSALADIFSGNYSTSSETEDTSNETKTHKEIFVIKAVVYEVGILTEVDDDDNSTLTDSNERLDLTFFQTHKNGSFIDLGDIPLPIQANISGQTFTQILPFHIGEVNNISEIISVLPLAEQILNFTSDENTSFNFTEASFPQVFLPVDKLGQPEDPSATILDKEELLKIPTIGETILVDGDFENEIDGESLEDSSSSSEEHVVSFEKQPLGD